MADVATPSAAKVATADTSVPEGKKQVVRPEKPDEEKFKEQLAKAEKEHTAAQEKLVSNSSSIVFGSFASTYHCTDSVSDFVCCGRCT